MPLSEDEQRRLDEMERALRRDDPKFAAGQSIERIWLGISRCAAPSRPAHAARAGPGSGGDAAGPSQVVRRVMSRTLDVRRYLAHPSRDMRSEIRDHWWHHPAAVQVGEPRSYSAEPRRVAALGDASSSWLVGWSWLVLWLRRCRCVQECRDLFGGQRRREVPALPGVAAEFAEPGELCCCFDGFGGDRQAQDVGELN